MTPLRDRVSMTLLIALVLACYAQTATFDFVNYDDRGYVLENAHVRSGFSLAAVAWAATSTQVYWHPLTWISHCIDWQWFGEWAGGHHLMNVGLFGLVVAALYKWLRELQLPAVLAVVGIWSLHPLRVESVAWISERKDILSGLFGLATLIIWQKYVQRPKWGSYLWALLAFALALMTKPTVVVLPAALLFLDYWPNRRKLKWSSLAREKIPFALMSLFVGLLTLFGQSEAGALALIDPPLALRVQNSLSSTVAYLGKGLLPRNLAAFYPYRPSIETGETVMCIVILLVITALVFWQRSRRPYLLFGWSWYLLFLLPTMGLIQAGRQSMADRFTFWPMIGLVLAIVLLVDDVVRHNPSWRRSAASGCFALCSIFAALTWKQTRYWHESLTLFERCLSAGGESDYTRGNLATSLVELGRYADAKAHLDVAIHLAPLQPLHHYNLGLVEFHLGNMQVAREQTLASQRLAPLDWRSLELLGRIDLKTGDYGSGIERLRSAAAIGGARHSYSVLLNDSGASLASLGRFDGAEILIRAAMEMEPELVEAHKNLALVLYDSGRKVEAREQILSSLSRLGQHPILRDLASHLGKE